MGCYNGTCAITQLAILSGEPCRIVFLRGKTDGRRGSEAGGGFCYPTGLWSPASLPIPAKYNDYGAVEDFDPEDWRVTLFLDWLVKVIVETKEGPNSYHDTPITKDRIREGGIEEVCSIIHSQPQRTRISDGVSRSLWASANHALKEVGEDLGEYQPDPLGYCLIREDVYQALIQTPIEGWRGVQTVQDTYTKADEWLAFAVEQVQAASSQEDAANGLVYLTLLQLHEAEFWREGEGSHGFLSHSRDAIVNRMVALLKEGGDLDAYVEEVRPKLRQIAEYRWVEWHMGGLRKFWSPQSGAGSQDDGIEAQKALIGIMQKALTTMRGRFEDEMPQEITDAFWKAWDFPPIQVPPRVYHTPERCKLADLVDAMGEPVPGVIEATGDGDGYGTLFVVDTAPDANLVHDHLYFVISEEGVVEEFTHGWPPGGMYGNILREVPQEDWPMAAFQDDDF